MKFFPLLLFLWAAGVLGQANRGEMRFVITDPSGAALRARIELDSSANGIHEAFDSDEAGRASIPMLPFGAYRLTIQRSGFAVYRATLDVHSAVPLERRVALVVAGTESDVRVTGLEPLVDLNAVTSTVQIGTKEIEGRVSSLPGRSVQDLVVSQPGWLYEGNAVLHPRGSEYQTQFVLDGIPLTDNRSPSFGPAIEADDLESLSIYTAGFPAEYGRKMGGVVELNTHRQTDPGWHGNLVLAGGSYDTLSGYGQLHETRKKDAFTASASGAHTSHYLNPVVTENYTNTGTLTDFAATYERDLDHDNRLIFSGRRESSRFEIPNELVQQRAGQVQTADNSETVGTARFQGIVSGDSLISISGMIRQNAKDLESNRNPTPIAAFQHNRFNEGYFKGTYALHRGRQELKAGVESDATFLHENFNYTITDATQFDAGTPASLTFIDSRPDLEQSAFVEDLVRMKDWTASVGLRWDHYQLLLNKGGLSPRIAVGRSFRNQDLVLHGSYDRVFQTPSFENILISNSEQVKALSSAFLRLPVKPSTGNDGEIGVTKGIAKRARVDVTSYWRGARNAADDDQLLNTGVSYPIAFNRSVTYGAEGKLQIIAAGPVSGFVSYSYMVAKVWFPVTGGLFLGDNAVAASGQISGHFPASQDQRNTLATRWEWQAGSRVRIAAGGAYGSGLPFDYGGTRAEAVAQYGSDVVSRLNFARGRVLPLLAINASLSAEAYRRDHLRMTIHVDGENLNDRLNVLDFGGLFSGNAIAPQRSVMVRWESRF